MADGKDQNEEESRPAFDPWGGRCSSFGVSNGSDFCGECVDREADYIDMEVGSAPIWESATVCSRKSKVNNNNIARAESREFEFDMSGINAQALQDHDAAAASPADELFYKGQLLPLHLPPRLQMVEKLISSESGSPAGRTLLYVKSGNNSDLGTDDHGDRCTDDDYDISDAREDFVFFEDGFADHVIDLTPYESCSVTPYYSCDASRELNPGLYDNNDINCNYNYNIPGVDPDRKTGASNAKRKPRLPILKKAKKFLDSSQYRQSALATKLRASRAFLRSLFTGSESSGSAKTSQNSDNNMGLRECQKHDMDRYPLMSPAAGIYADHMDIDPEDLNLVSRTRDCLNRYMKVLKPVSTNLVGKSKEHGSGSIRVQRKSYHVAAAVARSIHSERSSAMIEDVNFNNHRKSFSGSSSSAKLSSQCVPSDRSKLAMNNSSSRSSPDHGGMLLKRSSSGNSDMENAIQGAIAHCKQSHAPKDNETPKLLGCPASTRAGGCDHGRPGSDSRFEECDKPGWCRG